MPSFLTRILRIFQVRGVERSRGEVLDLLRRGTQGEVSDMEWDDFVCVRVSDPELDRIREAALNAMWETGSEEEERQRLQSLWEEVASEGGDGVRQG